MKKGFTLMELLTVIVIISIVSAIGFMAISFIIERTKMSSLNISAHAVEKSVSTYIASNRVNNGINTYDLLSTEDISTYTKLGDDPWGHEYVQVVSYVIKNGAEVETNVFIEVQDKGCFYLIEGESTIEEYDCDLDPSKNGLYTEIVIKNLDKGWHDKNVAFTVMGKLFINGLPTRGGASHICYELNSAPETCIPADKKGKAIINVTSSGVNNYNVYSKGQFGYSIDKNQKSVTIKIDKTIPSIVFTPNSHDLVCTNSNNDVDTPVSVSPEYGPSGGEYRYRWYTDGNPASWSSNHVLPLITTAKTLGRRQLEVEISNNAGVKKKYMTGDFNLEGPIMSYDYKPGGINLPYGGTQELKINFKCSAGAGNISTCGAKFADSSGSGGAFDYTSSPSLAATKTISVRKSDVSGRRYLWMRGTTSRGCSIPSQGLRIDQIFS